MASRRTVQINDRRRNSAARKRTHASGIVRQKQQAEVLAKLVADAKKP